MPARQRGRPTRLLEDLPCPFGIGVSGETKQIKMDAEEKVSWLNAHARPRKWRVGEDVRCRLCGAVFKAERTVMDFVGEPTCPHCIASTTADFEKVMPRRKP
jgi:hypothetical protein